MTLEITPSDEASRAAVEAVTRDSYGRLLAVLAVWTRDIHAAEDALAGALSSALVAWASRGVPSNPSAWVLTVARRRLIDEHRRLSSDRERAGRFGHELQRRAISATAPAEPDEMQIPDERLRLLFVCAHPAIDPAVRAPLMLQCVLGIDADRIAGACLIAPAAMRQRLVRAKAKIRDACISFDLPAADRLPGRTADVLDAVYAAFTLGWDAALGAGEAPDATTAGLETPGSLADEALHLARLTASLMPSDPEALGLASLLGLVHARQAARRSPRGEYVPLATQDPSLWDTAMIEHAEGLLRQAASAATPGRFQIEAAIQSAHIHGVRSGTTDWPVIIDLYDLLLRTRPSLGALLGRAAAIAEGQGVHEGLRALDALDPATLRTHQPYHAVRGMLLLRSGQLVPAGEHLRLAAGLTHDPAVREFLLATIAG